MVIGQPHTDVTTDATRRHLDGRHLDALHHGVGRAIVDEIATDFLNATVIDV